MGETAAFDKYQRVRNFVLDRCEAGIISEQDRSEVTSRVENALRAAGVSFLNIRDEACGATVIDYVTVIMVRYVRERYPSLTRELEGLIGGRSR